MWFDIVRNREANRVLNMGQGIHMMYLKFSKTGCKVIVGVDTVRDRLVNGIPGIIISSAIKKKNKEKKY